MLVLDTFVLTNKRWCLTTNVLVTFLTAYFKIISSLPSTGYLEKVGDLNEGEFKNSLKLFLLKWTRLFIWSTVRGVNGDEDSFGVLSDILEYFMFTFGSCFPS